MIKKLTIKHKESALITLVYFITWLVYIKTKIRLRGCRMNEKEVKEKVIQGFMSREYTHVLADIFQPKEEFLRLADLYEKGLAIVFTKHDFCTEMKQALVRLENVAGQEETVRKIKSELIKAQGRKVIVITVAS